MSTLCESESTGPAGRRRGRGTEDEVGHVHRVKTVEIRCFLGPVAQKQNQAAHGGHCRHETCRCGARRRVNVNGLHTERGRWTEAD
jgi:hypothetical protein